MLPHDRLFYAPQALHLTAPSRAAAIEGDRAHQRQGTTILVYSNFPNGNPIDQLSQKQVYDIMKDSLPGTIIDPTHMVYGRVQNENKVDVGAIVYPITESQYRTVQSTVQANKGDVFKTEEDINKRLLPAFIKKDMKGGQNPPMIYDMSRKRTLFPEEIKQLSGDTSATAIQARDRQSVTARPPKAGKRQPAARASAPTQPQKRHARSKQTQTHTISGDPSLRRQQTNIPKSPLPAQHHDSARPHTSAKQQRTHAAAAPQQRTHKVAPVPYQYHAQNYSNAAYSTEADRGAGPTPNPYKPLIRGQHAPSFPGMVESWPNGSPS
jgi:hypothetical protein